MWTWTYLVSLALIVQASHGIRTFPQDQIPWKEVENEVLGHSFGKDTNKPVDDLHLEDYVKQVRITPENQKFDLASAPTSPTLSSTFKPETTAEILNRDGDNHFIEELFSSLADKENPSQSLTTATEPTNIIKIRRISPIYRKKLLTIRIKKDPEPINSSPLPFMDARENGDLERIIEEAGKVMDALSSDQKDEGQPISMLKSLNQEQNIDTNNNDRNMYEVLTKMMKNTQTTGSDDEAPSCGSPIDENEDSSDRKTIVRIKISPMVQTSPPRNTPTLRGLMLKPLLPRDFFIVKDLLDTMKSRALTNHNNDEERDMFRTNPSLNPRISERYIAFSPKIIPRNLPQLPPLHFPGTGPQLFQSPDPKNGDIDRILKAVFSTRDSNDDQLKDLLNRFQNQDVKTATEIHNLNNSYEEGSGSEPELDDLVNFLLPALARGMPSEVKDSLIPALGKMLASGKLDLKRDIPIHYRRQLMKMTIGK